MKTIETPETPRNTHNAMNIAQIAAILANSEATTTPPEALVSKAAALIRAAERHAEAEQAAHDLKANIFTPLREKGRAHELCKEWERKLFAFPGDKAKLADELASETLERDAVLRELFRATSETQESREARLKSLLEFAKANAALPRDAASFESEARAELNAPSKHTFTERCLQANAARNGKPRFSLWLCRWLVAQRIAQLSVARSTSAAQRTPPRKKKGRKRG
jgi:hypothetical protein